MQLLLPADVRLVSEQTELPVRVLHLPQLPRHPQRPRQQRRVRRIQERPTRDPLPRPPVRDVPWLVCGLDRVLPKVQVEHVVARLHVHLCTHTRAAA